MARSPAVALLAGAGTALGLMLASAPTAAWASAIDAGGMQQQGTCQMPGLPLGSSGAAGAGCDADSSTATPAATPHPTLTLAIVSCTLLILSFYVCLLTTVVHTTISGMRRGRALKKQWPRYKETQAEVVMCLRGGDSTLDQLFDALARQTHRAWLLRVIVDSPEDSGAEVARAAIARLGAGASWQSASVEPLLDRTPATGSLKCASLIQAYRSLQPETAVVVGVDGDAIIQPEWLVTLIVEAQQPGVGAASGNRWFEPTSMLDPAGFIRSIWGFSGVAIMQMVSVPWGGSLAVRREVVEGSEWLADLATCFCEDTALAGPLWKAGWRYVWVPSIVSIDSEPPGAFAPTARWLARQLLCAHMHHPLFAYTLTPFAIGGGAATFALAGAIARGAATHDGYLAALSAGALLAMHGGMAVCVSVERAVLRRYVLRPLGLSASLPPRAAARWALGVVIWMVPTVVVTGLGSLWCLLATEVEWRGIIYRRSRSRAWIVDRLDGLAVHARDGAAAVAAAGGRAGKPGAKAMAYIAAAAAPAKGGKRQLSLAAYCAGGLGAAVAHFGGGGAPAGKAVKAA